MRSLDADRCSIFFVDEMRKEVWCVGSLDMEPFCMDWDKGIVGMVANEGQVVNLPGPASRDEGLGSLAELRGMLQSDTECCELVQHR
ncbi:unnamed protein product [Durusdinium trenchii]|uniref:Uncharacterized protein n=1 Tax=Durusdinium trenchii TaxID=1381693 RepID=A0ABP0LV25_9DINO